MEQEELSSVLESILFVTDKPVTRQRLMEVLGEEVISEQELSSIITVLQQKYSAPSHGFELREAQGGVHFCTKVSNAEWVRKFLATKPFRLSRTALEALAIIAYRQPITRTEIDKVRGVDSSHLVRTLIERGLVKMAGKADVPGRPVQYATTPRFLEVVGLNNLSELPPLSELEQLQGSVEDTLKPLEQGLERFISEKTELSQNMDDTEGLQEIEGMLSTVQHADRQIYESKEHAEVAQENEAALEGFLAHNKPFRKQRKKDNAVEALTVSTNPIDFDGVPANFSPTLLDEEI